MPHRAYIGIGSNLGDRAVNCATAIERIRALPRTRLLKVSSVYESEPHGDAKTWFVNAVIEIETELTAEDLLKKLLAIETAMGRKRVSGKRWGARVIDLDLLLFEAAIIEKRNLKVPHPEIPNRKFVLAPLAEVAPQLVHPKLGITVTEMLSTTRDRKRIHLMRPT
ncbi:2-amino-4-hydroxy-6-hydroxymethyldihydropteridine diphosphokinase [Candidatus Binatia bacterium]|nr:2-amino-4-hydroxy-6-hydroxymethyldihydropteridine diphosphokinase [Candidatus Binatia bacterium]